MTAVSTHSYKGTSGEDFCDVTMACDGPGCDARVVVAGDHRRVLASGVDPYSAWTVVMREDGEGHDHYCSRRCYLAAAVQEAADGTSLLHHTCAEVRWRLKFPPLPNASDACAVCVGSVLDAILLVQNPLAAIVTKRTADDEFPLLEEVDDLDDLPTVNDWLAKGGPMREVDR